MNSQMNRASARSGRVLSTSHTSLVCVPQRLSLRTEACILVFCCKRLISDSLATLWTVAHQVPLSMGFLRQDD